MKSRYRTLSTLITVVLGIMALTATVGFGQFGQDPGRGGFAGPGPHHGPGGGDGFLRGLNLSDEQKAKIEEIQKSFAESNKALFEQMHSLHDKEFANSNPGTFDEAAVRAAAQARANVQIELDVAHARMFSQIYNLLTAEQKAELQRRRQEFEARRAAMQ
jgi:periplasmic protein CpxP/Spy